MENGSSVKPSALICEILSGYFAIIVAGVAYAIANPRNIDLNIIDQAKGTVLAGIAAGSFVVAWIVGTFLDSCGDVLESLLDLWAPLNWDYLTTATSDQLDRLNSWHYAYYSLTRNYTVAGICIILLLATRLFALPVLGVTALCVFIVVSAAEAWILRGEIAKIMGTQTPDEGVFARLGASDLHGVGVFAIRDIKKGTYVFEPDDSSTVKFDAQKVEKLPAELRQLYYDFGVLSKGKYTVPINFNKLTISWYLNETPAGSEPNVAPDDDLRFFALRDISAGEELTARYGDYSGSPPGA